MDRITDLEFSLSAISDTMVTAQLICAFVFAHANNRVSHEVAQLMCGL